jgi:hypothetical protein
VAILSLHTLASPSGKNVNYDKENFLVVGIELLPGFVNTCSVAFLSQISVITENIRKRPVYVTQKSHIAVMYLACRDDRQHPPTTVFVYWIV